MDPEQYDPELDSNGELPVRPKVTLYALLVVVFLFLLLLKRAKVLAWSWWWISLPLWILPTGYGLRSIITWVSKFVPQNRIRKR
ncbi:hypothetical protein EXU85_16190 [Spirosoma sp. KCTC 42546]|uniref:hypothetical protein n=1 Tax=Spirosoma sp. KCTC 42546 TaxID=2520506 RepID=UPI0011585DEB|nr:hypothetical protein [Spirosoma sp. KCTC 42546]QDK80064.1 hypothetical protein EXU85_16190 [Spirosoma sp. KCTC 42546]